jgi:HTH-type transcriptional regulator/antitoxin HipB
MSLMKDITLRSAEQLGTAIRLARKQKQISQSALAATLGVERKWVLRLEAGNPRAELGLVLKALAALGIRASLGQPDRPGFAGKSPTVTASRLDEVLQRLQHPTRK